MHLRRLRLTDYRNLPYDVAIHESGAQFALAGFDGELSCTPVDCLCDGAPCTATEEE